MLFSYKAVNKEGTEYESTVEATDKFAVYKAIHAKGEAVIYVHEKSAKGGIKKLLSISWGGVSMADRVMFAKNLGAMIRAGLPLVRALTVLDRQITNKAWKKIFTTIQDNLAKGVSLSSSLAAFPKIFSSLFTAMVAAGEESGNMAGSLTIVGEELEKSYELRKKVRGAMLYPAIILGVMLTIGILMFVYVMPKLIDTFKDFGADLPLATRMIISMSEFLQAYYLAIIGAVIVGSIAAVVFSRSSFGKKVLHSLLLKIPIIGTIAQEINAARTARTLSSLLSSGVQVVPAIKITRDVIQNVSYKEMLTKIADEVQRGSTLQSLFAARTDLYPSFVSEMIGVGEETGTISKTLLEVALFYENEVDQKTKNMSTVIEPFLMVIIGLAVAFFALAMISPIYSLSNNIN